MTRLDPAEEVRGKALEFITRANELEHDVQFVDSLGEARDTAFGRSSLAAMRLLALEGARRLLAQSVHVHKSRGLDAEILEHLERTSIEVRQSLLHYLENAGDILRERVRDLPVYLDEVPSKREERAAETFAAARFARVTEGVLAVWLLLLSGEETTVSLREIADWRSVRERNPLSRREERGLVADLEQWRINHGLGLFMPVPLCSAHELLIASPVVELLAPGFAAASRARKSQVDGHALTRGAFSWFDNLLADMEDGSLVPPPIWWCMIEGPDFPFDFVDHPEMPSAPFVVAIVRNAQDFLPTLDELAARLISNEVWSYAIVVADAWDNSMFASRRRIWRNVIRDERLVVYLRMGHNFMNPTVIRWYDDEDEA